MPETDFDDLKTDLPWTGNLSALIHATLALLLVALPFKNVFYHFALFILLFCFCLYFTRAGHRGSGRTSWLILPLAHASINTAPNCALRSTTCVHLSNRSASFLR